MRYLAPRVLYSLALYSLVMATLVVARPAAVFEPDGRPRRFGTGPGDTLVSLGVVSSAAACVSTFAFALVDALLAA